ncbi:MAG: response regulator [Mogibacterium sp.]|nr:response regulator [Mogibacterium sp.]
MTYSIIGILAAIILLIINRDVLWASDGKTLSKTEKNYRRFLRGIMAYLITDMLWGILDANHLITANIINTSIHFIAMAAAVMLWTRYVISYLEKKNLFGSILYYSGSIFLGLVILAVIVNIFRPVIFSFDENGTYSAGIARYLILAVQIVLFLLTSVYTLNITTKTEGKEKRRHMTIGLFGVAMTAFILVQVFYPLLPFYAMGYMLGTCVLHSFVVEDEKDEYQKALAEALEEAERANMAKTAFLSNMSHEIRTPMNAIIGLNKIAMEDPTVSGTVREHLKKVDGSAQHLLNIINDILDMSRIESGRIAIKNEEFPFAREIEQVNSMIGSQCKEKGLDYEFRVIGKTDDYYVGDGMRIRQIVINLLGNAVKFTPKGGKVSFVIEEGPRSDEEAELRFVVSDTGIGMSEEFLPQLFDAFSQEDSSSTNIYGSSGLGMAITKRMVELMGGSIEVESVKGEGSTFTVTLTLGLSDRRDNAADRSAEASEENTAGLGGRRILLAEDVVINAEIIKMVLTQAEIKVDHAENGRIATEMFRDHDEWYYDAILMDMRMPEMDGLEATRTIRAMDRADAAKIPIIALTANAFEEDVQRSMEAGLNAHLSKPVEPETLFRTLGDLIEKCQDPEI